MAGSPIATAGPRSCGPCRPSPVTKRYSGKDRPGPPPYGSSAGVDRVTPAVRTRRKGTPGGSSPIHGPTDRARSETDFLSIVTATVWRVGRGERNKHSPDRRAIRRAWWSRRAAGRTYSGVGQVCADARPIRRAGGGGDPCRENLRRCGRVSVVPAGRSERPRADAAALVGPIGCASLSSQPANPKGIGSAPIVQENLFALAGPGPCGADQHDARLDLDLASGPLRDGGQPFEHGLEHRRTPGIVQAHPRPSYQAGAARVAWRATCPVDPRISRRICGWFESLAAH